MEFGGNVRHFLGLTIAVFAALFLFYLYRDDQQNLNTSSSLKIYATNSFIGSWGPGPELKDLFEKQTGLKVSFLEMGETSQTLQKLASDGVNSVGDLVLSLDQFDLIRQADKIKWVEFVGERDFELPTAISEWKNQSAFTAYNYAPIAFIARKDFHGELRSLSDILKPEYKGKISLQDPRTSSPGLQLLYWIMRTHSESEAIDFIRQLKLQAHSFSNSWSASYGLFKEKQSDMVLSYVTSPIYHLIEEKDGNYRSFEFSEGHPVQVEFAGIPESCKNCEAAKKFVNFLLTPAAQKIIMNKNYMLPVYRPAQDGTAFDTIKVFRNLMASGNSKSQKIPTKTELQNWLNLWGEISRSESQ